MTDDLRADLERARYIVSNWASRCQDDLTDVLAAIARLETSLQAHAAALQQITILLTQHDRQH